MELTPRRNNPEIPLEARQEALKNVERIASPDLVVNNQAFYEMHTEGFPVTYRKDGVERGDRVQLVNFENPEPMRVLALCRPDLRVTWHGKPVTDFRKPNHS